MRLYVLSHGTRNARETSDEQTNTEPSRRATTRARFIIRVRRFESSVEFAPSRAV